MPEPIPSRPFVIAGGGVAALEAALALRAKAGPEVPVQLVCPTGRFVNKSLSVLEPFAHVAGRTASLADFAEQHGVTWRRDRIAAVRAHERSVELGSGETIAYRALIVATGAGPSPALPGVVTFSGQDDAAALRGALDHAGSMESATLAFIVPDPGGWVLPLYELALLSRAELDAQDRTNTRVVVLTAEEQPLAAMGDEVSDLMQMLLARSGVRVCAGVKAVAVRDRAVELDDGSVVPADHAFALPRWNAAQIEGLSAGEDGFIEIDAFGRVRGEELVYAAGDITAGFPKQGGLAAAQAESAVSAMLADLGWPIEPVAFDDMLCGVLLTGDVLEAIRHAQAGDRQGWVAPEKIVARRLAAYLGGREPESRDEQAWQKAGRIPGEIEVAG